MQMVKQALTICDAMERRLFSAANFRNHATRSKGEKERSEINCMFYGLATNHGLTSKGRSAYTLT